MHVSFAEKSLAGSSVYVVALPPAVAEWLPLEPHEIENQAPVTSTGSLNVTLMFAPTGTFASPLPGDVETTWGGWSPGLLSWAPSPSKVSVANPFHSSAGLKASLPLGSPA